MKKTTLKNKAVDKRDRNNRTKIDSNKRIIQVVLRSKATKSQKIRELYAKGLSANEISKLEALDAHPSMVYTVVNKFKETEETE